jgi:NNP family nitrate/nitrite transporter-like MFS transporter
MPLLREKKTLLQALAVLRYPHTWFLSLLYFISFGVFMFFAIYLPTPDFR